MCRPDISSDAFRTKAAPTHKPSVSTGDLSSIPIAMLKAQVTPSSKKPSGIPRAAAAAPSVKLHGDSVDVPDAGKWHERLRGGPSKPVKGNH